MIHFVTTRDHSYTNESLIERHGSNRISLWSYDHLFFAKSIPTGTWVFTDHERLSPLDLSKAAHFARVLEENGARILNHPARVRSRFEILRRLNEAGINQFSAYRCDSNPEPRQFPVFIRNAFDHKGELASLIETQADLDAELMRLEKTGVPLIGKLVIEYSGEEFIPGVWRRLSTYCVAGKIISHHMAFSNSWIVKNGLRKHELQVHPEEDRFLETEWAFVTKNQYADVLEQAFSIAGIDYGRADFSLKNNRVQIFEINTNPTHGYEADIFRKIHPGRAEFMRHSERQLQTAIVELNQPGKEKILLYGSLWARIKRRLEKAIKRGRPSR